MMAIVRSKIPRDGRMKTFMPPHKLRTYDDLELPFTGLEPVIEWTQYKAELIKLIYKGDIVWKR